MGGGGGGGRNNNSYENDPLIIDGATGQPYNQQYGQQQYGQQQYGQDIQVYSSAEAYDENCPLKPKYVFVFTLIVLVIVLIFAPWGSTVPVQLECFGNYKSSEGTTWISEVKVYTQDSPDTKAGEIYQLLYFKDCPPADTIRNHYIPPRDETIRVFYASSIDYLYLNEGSVVSVQWEAARDVYFQLYVGQKNFDNFKFSYQSKGTAKNDTITAERDDIYYFVWERQENSLANPLPVSASYSVALRIYDPDVADAKCQLHSNTCKFKMDRSSKNCVVLDNQCAVDADPTYVEFDISWEGRLGFYFSMFLVVPVGAVSLLALVLWAIKKHSNKSSSGAAFHDEEKFMPADYNTSTAPAAQAYPAQGYAPQQPVYPPQQAGYPPAQGYPPPAQGYPPPAQGYPPPAQGYEDKKMEDSPYMPAADPTPSAPAPY